MGNRIEFAEGHEWSRILFERARAIRRGAAHGSVASRGRSVCRSRPRLVFVLCALVCTTGLAIGQKADPSKLRRVVEPGGLLSDTNTLSPRLASCQPARGDSVVTRGSLQAAEGRATTPFIEVVVTSGRCKGAQGSIAPYHLTPAAMSREVNRP